NRERNNAGRAGGMKRGADGLCKGEDSPSPPPAAATTAIIGGGGAAVAARDSSTNQWITNSALEAGLVHIRALLREFPLFAPLPSDTLHHLGLSAQPRAYPPFTTIIQQNS